MQVNANEKTVTVSIAELEGLMRRVVREELTRLLQSTKPSVSDDWSQEGPDDPEGDAELLSEALRLREEYRQDKTGWMSLDKFEAELDRAEAAGELPR